MTVPDIHLTKTDLDAMTPQELNTLLLKATKIHVTAVVRRRDGSIRYDDPTLAGTYGEASLPSHEASNG